jgi:hypothetical protein
MFLLPSQIVFFGRLFALAAVLAIVGALAIDFRWPSEANTRYLIPQRRFRRVSESVGQSKC